MGVRLVTDSTCDLPRDLIESHGITVVPLTVVFGEESFLDGVEISADEFYERMRSSAATPKTSQPSVERFRRVYESLAGEEVLSIHLSAGLSGTLNSATIAREQLPGQRIEILDSTTVSMGLGGVVLEAATVAAQGGTMDEVIAAARRAMEHVRVICLVDTLEYLRRGGRIGRAQSMLGSLLSIKPIVQFENGEVAPFDKVRTRHRAVERLFEISTEDPNLKRVFVGCGGNDKEAEAFLERLRPHLPNTEFHLGLIGPVVGTYSGPNALGVALLGGG